MDDRILNSVIEITRQCDTDSLEYSLVATLAEMVPSKVVSICKSPREHGIESLEEVIHLRVVFNDSGEKKYEWVHEARSVPDDPQIEECLTETKAITRITESGSLRLLIPINCKRETIGVVILESDRDISSYHALIEGLVRIYENYLNILSESERDKLTGLLNRRTFDKKLSRLILAQKNARINDLLTGKYQQKRRLEENSFTWLAILDIDHFKRVNDTYGHVCGDEILLAFAQKMNASFRRSDLLFRFGGEEFLVILEPIPFENAYDTLERFRKTVADHHFPLVEKVTISIGFAKLTEDDYPPVILEHADKALYYAKEHGRNRVYAY